ncbi:hypothetical protein MBLNU459_g2800t1 [Dothideomycetes sp. NU459]
MEALERWFKENGGYLHPSVNLAQDALHGSHFRATSAIPPGTHVLTVPHQLALSNLNALVDNEFPAFKTHAKSFTVEALTFFYLMAQWINKDKSFWKPYLNTLPTPDEGFNTPLWFDEEDRTWLEGTDLHPTVLKREEIWQQYWRDGVDVLESAGMDMQNYTWQLFKWAATVYSSRSFNSQTVQPHDGKYWTAYRGSPHGRQPVSVDLGDFPDDWKIFSVLFPVMDAGNHNPIAKIDWAYDTGKFSLTVSEPIDSGDQIFNNYGPKGNDELLMGYGFCSPSNMHDGALLTMRPPPPPLQEMLRPLHPGYFTPAGVWDPSATTFRLLRSLLPDATSTSSTSIWRAIPTPLVELLAHTVRFERGLPVTAAGAAEQRCLPRIAQYVAAALAPKIARLAAATRALSPSSSATVTPRNPRQANALVYREGQAAVLRGVQAGLGQYLAGLRPRAAPCVAATGVAVEYGPGLWTLEQAVAVLEVEAPEAHGEFLAGLKSLAGTGKLRKLRGTEAEEEVWAILLCFVHLHVVALQQAQVAGSDGDEDEEEGMLEKWKRSLEVEYGAPAIHDDDSSPPMGAEDGDEDAAEYLDRVKAAGKSLPGSLWTSPAWTAEFVLDWGVRIAKSQGMFMDVSEDDADEEQGDGDVRYVVYLHVEEQDVEVCEI